MPQSCLIVGGGICGPIAALALHRIGIRCHIYEARDSPTTVGGAFSLPPNALRLLDYLGVAVPGCRVDAIEVYSVHTAKKLGELPFRKHGHSLRVMRRDLQTALLRAIESAQIPITYSAKLVGIAETGGEPRTIVTATFADGKTATASFLLGCDGIHSTVRNKYVDTTSSPTYTGTAGVYALFQASAIKSPIPFPASALNLSKSGMLLTTYADEKHTQLYFAAVMQTKAEEDKQGWQARGEDYTATVNELRRRYGDAENSALKEMVHTAAESELFLYPIFELDSKTQWTRGQVLLLGDAAHAVSLTFPCFVSHIKNEILRKGFQDAPSRRISWPSSRRRCPSRSCS